MPVGAVIDNEDCKVIHGDRLQRLVREDMYRTLYQMYLIKISFDPHRQWPDVEHLFQFVSAFF